MDSFETDLPQPLSVEQQAAVIAACHDSFLHAMNLSIEMANRGETPTQGQVLAMARGYLADRLNQRSRWASVPAPTPSSPPPVEPEIIQEARDQLTSHLSVLPPDNILITLLMEDQALLGEMRHFGVDDTVVRENWCQQVEEWLVRYYGDSEMRRPGPPYQGPAMDAWRLEVKRAAQRAGWVVLPEGREGDYEIRVSDAPAEDEASDPQAQREVSVEQQQERARQLAAEHDRLFPNAPPSPEPDIIDQCVKLIEEHLDLSPHRFSVVTLLHNNQDLLGMMRQWGPTDTDLRERWLDLVENYLVENYGPGLTDKNWALKRTNWHHKVSKAGQVAGWKPLPLDNEDPTQVDRVESEPAMRDDDSPFTSNPFGVSPEPEPYGGHPGEALADPTVTPAQLSEAEAAALIEDEAAQQLAAQALGPDSEDQTDDQTSDADADADAEAATDGFFSSGYDGPPELPADFWEVAPAPRGGILEPKPSPWEREQELDDDEQDEGDF